MVVWEKMNLSPVDHDPCCLDRALALLMSLFLLLQLSAVGEALNLDSCQGALGMESGMVSNDRILASSSFDQDSVGAQYARVRVDKAGGAWCPGRPIDRNSYEYLQINLLGVHVVTAVETQGRHAGGQGKEYPTYYMLEYRRAGSEQWLRYRTVDDHVLIKANVDTNTPVKIVLDAPLIAESVRFVPFSQHPRTTCMRVELYGCKYDDGLMSYSMPQGDVSADLLYDGAINDTGYLSGGLGALLDGRTDYFVSWNRAELEIEFNFDRLRDFSAIQLYLGQLRQPCEEMRLSFSAEDRSYQSAVVLPFRNNLSMPVGQPGWLNVAIPRLYAVNVRMRFFTGEKLFQMAEVRFVSEIVAENLTISLGGDDPRGNQQLASFVTDAPGSGVSNSLVPLEYAALACGVLGFCLVAVIVLLIVLRRRKLNRLPAYSDFKSLPVAEHIAVDLKAGQTRVISTADSWSPFLPASPRVVNTYAFDQKPLIDQSLLRANSCLYTIQRPPQNCRLPSSNSVSEYDDPKALHYAASQQHCQSCANNSSSPMFGNLPKSDQMKKICEARNGRVIAPCLWSRQRDEHYAASPLVAVRCLRQVSPSCPRRHHRWRDHVDII